LVDVLFGVLFGLKIIVVLEMLPRVAWRCSQESPVGKCLVVLLIRTPVGPEQHRARNKAV
jgi:hypothetical protein